MCEEVAQVCEGMQGCVTIELARAMGETREDMTQKYLLL